MSAAQAFVPVTAEQVAQAAPRRSAPFLAPVIAPRESRRRRPRIVYATVAVVGVFAILVTQLLLSIALSEGAYRISALATQASELDRDAQVLVESLDALRSPQHLAANAEALGMVSNASPAYLQLADATVLGAPVAAEAGGGLLGGRDTMIGNVLLADMALATPASGGGASSVASTPPVPGSLASQPAQPGLAGSLPSPVTR
ncbi:MAG: hypothetical protein RJQ01_07500 [Microcella sp.]|uniref:hypothetical protein n=1 Tax=Microcella sp. TaxID=1913979 RepID=UPI003314BC41